MKKEMKKSLLIVTAVLALIAATAGVALAGSDRGADKEPIVRIFDDDGVATDGSEVLGSSKLIRRDDGLKTTVNVSGLRPGGLYTYWWVVIPAGGVFPDDAFAASAGGKVVGKNGKATARMNADLGQESIEGFLIPFQPLNFDLATAEVHVEIAYHGQAVDIANVDEALGNFWSGPACPDNGNNPAGTGPGESNPGQPHCPVSIVAIHNP